MSFNTRVGKTSRLGITVFLMICIFVAAVLAVVVLTQQVPQVTVPAGAVGISNCSTVIQEGTVTPVTGLLTFDCGVSKTAFSITTAGITSPSFVLPQGYTALALNATISGCSGTLISITSGQPHQLAIAGYDYCLSYNVPGGGNLATFTITFQ